MLRHCSTNVADEEDRDGDRDGDEEANFIIILSTRTLYRDSLYLSLFSPFSLVASLSLSFSLNSTFWLPSLCLASRIGLDPVC